MILDIEPTKEKHINCIEQAIETASFWFGRKCIMIYSQAWGFYYSHKSTLNSGKLMHGVDYGTRDNTLELLEWYHGIHVKLNKDSDNNNILDILKNELINNRPVWVYMDLFWCPWHPRYKKVSGIGHVSLVVGIDEHINNVYLIDTNKVHIQPLDHFLNGFHGYGLFSLVKNEAIDKIKSSCIISKTLDNLYRPVGESKNSFDAIRKFSEEIFNATPERIVAHDFDNVEAEPIFTFLKRLGWRRIMFARVVDFISHTSGNNKLLKYAENLRQAGNCWRVVCNTMLKAHVMHYPSSVLHDGGKEVLRIADIEENVARALSDYI